MERKAKKERKEQEARERAAERALRTPNTPAARARRSAAFKRNKEKFGIQKAKWIAWIITQRQKRNFWNPSEEARAKTANQRDLGFVD